MNIFRYLDTNFNINDPINKLTGKLGTYVTSLKSLTSIRKNYFGVKIDYIVDRVGIDVIEAFDDSYEFKKIIPDLSENCLFFCGKELVYSSANNKFNTKLVLLGFVLEEPIESFDGFSPIYNGHIHIKNDYFRE
jgi:hypothetical protein